MPTLIPSCNSLTFVNEPRLGSRPVCFLPRNIPRCVCRLNWPLGASPPSLGNSGIGVRRASASCLNMCRLGCSRLSSVFGTVAGVPPICCAGAVWLGVAGGVPPTPRTLSSTTSAARGFVGGGSHVFIRRAVSGTGRILMITSFWERPCLWRSSSQAPFLGTPPFRSTTRGGRGASHPALGPHSRLWRER